MNCLNYKHTIEFYKFENSEHKLEQKLFGLSKKFGMGAKYKPADVRIKNRFITDGVQTIKMYDDEVLEFLKNNPQYYIGRTLNKVKYD